MSRGTSARTTAKATAKPTRPAKRATATSAPAPVPTGPALAGIPVKMEPGAPFPALAAFMPPSRGEGLAWTPADEAQRVTLERVMAPTLRYWAASLGGWPSPVARADACYYAADALRRALLDWWQRDRAHMPKGMLARAWWQHLTEAERGVLTTLARSGAGAVIPARRAQ